MRREAETYITKYKKDLGSNKNSICTENRAIGESMSVDLLGWTGRRNQASGLSTMQEKRMDNRGEGAGVTGVKKADRQAHGLAELIARVGSWMC